MRRRSLLVRGRQIGRGDGTQLLFKGFEPRLQLPDLPFAIKQLPGQLLDGGLLMRQTNLQIDKPLFRPLG